jgi:hypothetical protein
MNLYIILKELINMFQLNRISSIDLCVFLFYENMNLIAFSQVLLFFKLFLVHNLSI